MAKRGPKKKMREKWLKVVLEYIKKHKCFPPQTTAIGSACSRCRQGNADFKRKTEAALKQAGGKLRGGKLQAKVAQERKRAILEYIKKHKRLPPQCHPLGPPCARFRHRESKFKKASDAALKKVGVMTRQEGVKKKRKQIFAYMKKHEKLPPQHTPLGYTAASYRTHDPEFKKQTDALRKKGHGIAPSEAVIKKRKQILSYMKKHKKLPPHHTPLGTAASNYRFKDPEFKKETDKYRKKRK